MAMAFAAALPPRRARVSRIACVCSAHGGRSLPVRISAAVIAAGVAAAVVGGGQVAYADVEVGVREESAAVADAGDVKALREISKRNTRTSGEAAQLFSKARREASAGALESALRMYGELVRMAPEFAPAFSNRANLYVALGRFEEAMGDYDRALQLAPLDKDAWVVYVNRGCTRIARGEDPYAALDDMNRAKELRGEDGVVLSNRAAVYETLGKYDAAIRDYQAALTSNDVQPFWNRYGLALFQRGKSYEALSILRRVAARFNVADVHASMAIVHFDRGEVADAETEWSKVDRPKLYETRSFLEKDRHWPPKAVEAMERFRKLKER